MNDWFARASLVLRQRVRALNRRRLQKRRQAQQLDYPAWVQAHDRLTPEVRVALAERLRALPAPLLISVWLLPSDEAALEQASLQSLQAQIYPHWALCRTADAAEGAWVLPLRAGDRLPEHALLLLAEAVTHFPGAALVYADHDHLDAQGQRHTPYFKPEWDTDLALAQEAFSAGLMALPRERLRVLGGSTGLHGLVLQASAGLSAQQIVHIPHVLCHRQAHAVDDTLAVRVHHPLPEPPPRVSVIIPTRNQVHLLRKCIETLTTLTDYPQLEVIVVDNGSDEPTAVQYIESLKTQPGLRVMHLPLRPFNYSALNNRAAELATGDVLVLMNNDIEVIDRGWLREMVSQALRPGVGAVGAKLLYPDGSVQHGGVILGLSKHGAGVASPAHKGLPGDAPGHGQRLLQVQSYSAVTAACLAVRKALYEQVGGLDETHLAVAYNDVDFCLKLREIGLRNVWTPHATLIHHESISRGRDVAPEKAERVNKEAARMRERWGTGLDNDPAYNPNLNATTADFALADPPRVSLSEPWFKRLGTPLTPH